MSKRHQSAWRELQQEHDRLANLLPHLKYNSEKSSDLLAAMYAVQALQTSGGMLEVSKSKFQSTALALARQLLEAVGRLEYLAFGPSDAYLRLELRDTEQTLKALSRLNNREDHPDIKGKIEECQARIKNRTECGVKGGLSFAEMLEAIGGEPMYSLFQMQSSTSHSEIFGLSHQFLVAGKTPMTVHIPSKLPEHFISTVNQQSAGLLRMVMPALARLGLKSDG